MKKILKKLNEFYAKGSDVGMVWFKTVFYYSFVPALLFLGLKSVDFKALIASFKGEPGTMIFNILKTVYSEFGLEHFLPIQTVLQQEFENSALLPIINYENTTIEKRAQSISKSLPQLLDQLKVKKAHIISYSLNGIDFRYYVSQMKGDEYVKSITTLSSPHLGSFLAESLNRKLFPHHNIEGLTRLMGVGLRSFHEFNKENIESFNMVCMNSKNTKYFSMGSSKSPNRSSEMLRNAVKYISENKIRNFITDNDGAFSLEETKWGKHFFNWNGDHGDLVGLGMEKDWEKLYRFCVDNIKFEEQERIIGQRNIEYV